MAEITVIQLAEPIDDHEGNRLTKLELKEPNAGIMRKIKGNLAQDMTDMCCQYITFACNLPPSVVNKLGSRDFNKQIIPVFLGFFADSLEIGDKSVETSPSVSEDSLPLK
jgi:hypothetical protein